MLAAYCRLTYSLAVIMLETTQSINNFLPTLLSIGVSMGVAKSINRSLYEYAIRMKQMPLLRNHMPEANKNIRVKDLLEKRPQEIEVVESVCQVDRLAEVCQMGFSSVPVVNMAGRIIGMIPTNFVIVLLENHCWYDEGKLQLSRDRANTVSAYYKTAITRQLSQVSASRSHMDDDDIGVGSPKGSVGNNSPKFTGRKVAEEFEVQEDHENSRIQKSSNSADSGDNAIKTEEQKALVRSPRAS